MRCNGLLGRRPIWTNVHLTRGFVQEVIANRVLSRKSRGCPESQLVTWSRFPRRSNHDQTAYVIPPQEMIGKTASTIAPNTSGSGSLMLATTKPKKIAAGRMVACGPHGEIGKDGANAAASIKDSKNRHRQDALARARVQYHSTHQIGNTIAKHFRNKP